MDRLNQDKAAKVGDILFRYMRARHRFKEKFGEVSERAIRVAMVPMIIEGEEHVRHE